VTDSLNYEDRVDVVNRIVQRLRKAYAAARCQAQRIPLTVLNDDNYMKCWQAVAKSCIEFGISPEEFVEVQFRFIKPWPTISQLCSEYALSRFFTRRGEVASNVAEKVMIQSGTFNRFMELGRDPAKVLLDPMQNYDALFIYVTAKLRNLDFAPRYFKSALVQYLTSVHYDGVYKDLIPEELRQEAQLVWETLQ
jgi:hypothetical protein